MPTIEVVNDMEVDKANVAPGGYWFKGARASLLVTSKRDAD